MFGLIKKLMFVFFAWTQIPKFKICEVENLLGKLFYRPIKFNRNILSSPHFSKFIQIPLKFYIKLHFLPRLTSSPLSVERKW